MNLEQYTTQQLEQELQKRYEQEKEAAKDRKPRTYYKKLNLSTIKEKADFLQNNPNADIKEYDNNLYIATQETPEEIKTRLTRKADAYEHYDQSRCDFYENGKEVDSKGYELLSHAEREAEMWENDREWWDNKEYLDYQYHDFPTSNRWFPLPM